MKLVYGVSDRPKLSQLIVYGFQQVLAIMAATIAVPLIVGNEMSTAAALCGAGIGTLTYVFFTKRKSPVFLGSSFAFIGSMTAAFAGAVSLQAGYTGLLLGALFAGLVYVVFALIIRKVGTHWINQLMPAIVIGPTVSIIGLSLAGNAVGDMLKFAPKTADGSGFLMGVHGWVGLICGLVTLFVVMICSVYGKKMSKLIPFIIGILASYIVALVLTLVGNATGIVSLQIIDLTVFNNMKLFQMPQFIFAGIASEGASKLGGISGVLNLFMLFAPVAFVTLAEHIADHKNLSSIINRDLIVEPGLHRTLLGDGVGSIIGAFFGGCPNTTYGECVGCVAITGDASVSTVFITAVYCILLSFFGPFIAFVNSVPACITGGVCIALYGFIAVSGLKLLQPVDLGDNRNLFVVASVLVTGIGGLTLNLGPITISPIATALILGIVVNALFNKRSD